MYTESHVTINSILLIMKHHTFCRKFCITIIHGREVILKTLNCQEKKECRQSKKRVVIQDIASRFPLILEFYRNLW